MTKSKKSIVMRGALLRPLVIGQGALLHAGGKILSYMFWTVTDFPPRPFFGGLSWMIKKQW